MAGTTQAVRSYLEKASPRFREIHESLARAVRELFPDAETSFQFRMPGWRILRPRRVAPASVRGTLAPNWVQVYLVERKSGITLHLWDPVDFNGFRNRKAELERAGFKLMVGCLRFNRKSEYPIDLAVELLKDVRNALQKDGTLRPKRVESKPPAPIHHKESKGEALRRQVEEWSSEPPMDGGD